MSVNVKSQIRNYFRAGYAGLFVTSFEEARVEAEILAVCNEVGMKLYTWTVTQSLVGPMSEPPDKRSVWKTENGEPLAPIELLAKMNDGTLDKKSVVIAKDLYHFLQDANPLMIRAVKDCLNLARAENRRLVVLACQFKLVMDLEKEFTPVEFGLPDRDQIGVVLSEIAESAGIHINGNADAIKDAAMGMTTTEAADAFALAVIETNKSDIPAAIVSREKSNVVKKNGLLEIIEARNTLDDVGGLENLKADLFAKRNLFTKAARDYGLKSPRGLLAVGQAGTGKSLTASTTGSIFNIPLVRLEAGKLFGSLVGSSEANWRLAFATAKAIAPCVLWVDEGDGLVSGAKSSGQTDGGTTLRVVKAILQDMQFNSDGIMWVFTANDIDGFPDALIDRLDVWSVDLPTQTEREAIFKIHTAKRGRKPDAYDIPAIARAMDGFSGRQMNEVWESAMTVAFNDGQREATTEDMIRVSKSFVPTSITMASQIEARRKRLDGKAKPAGVPEQLAVAKGRAMV